MAFAGVDNQLSVPRDFRRYVVVGRPSRFRNFRKTFAHCEFY